MLLLFVAIGLVEAVGSSCLPLPDNETVWYEYYEYVENRHTVGEAATKDTSGNYPPQTHARAHCKALSKKADPGVFVAICYQRRGSQWMYYRNITACPDPRCEPLKKSVSVSYEYYTKAAEGKGMGTLTNPDGSGKYPEQTLVRRYCNELPRNSLAQAETYAECLDSEWKLKNLPDCRFAAGCDEEYLLEKLMFSDISYWVNQPAKFSEDNTYRHYRPGSRVTAKCKGESVKLTCADGGHWVTADGRKALCE
uniref:Transforming growth factor beta mimic 9 n=1 Tax=Heligmosomoides polygyrus bakeri TaxID=375939 RepID=A0A2P1IQ82_HELBE|nr:transforming growth factor beta mimic 9 [Heligmosomoides bakeri]